MIAILIPCYNEEQTIRTVIRKCKEALPEAQIYVYDNNSTDKSARIAKEENAIVCHCRMQGKGHVVKQMFCEIDADCYVMIDADDTYPVEEMPNLIEPIIKNEADMVIGDRLSTTYKDENKRPFHNSGNKLVRHLVNKLFDSNISDVMTGYRAMNKNFVKNIDLKTGGFEIETEMTIKAITNKYVIKSIPITYKDRPEGSCSKLHTVKDGTKILRKILQMYRQKFISKKVTHN